MDRRVRSRLIAATTLLFLTASLALVGQKSSAEPPDPEQQVRLAEIAQVPLTDLNERIEGILQVQPALRETSYAGSSIDIDAMTYNLYWKGAMPQSVELVLESAPASISVNVHAARYSWGELLSAGRQLMRTHPEVLDFYFRDDRSGIDAGVASRVVLPSEFEGVPVSSHVSEPAISASRPDDQGAWHAGALDGSFGSRDCSNGWPLKKYNPPI